MEDHHNSDSSSDSSLEGQAKRVVFHGNMSSGGDDNSHEDNRKTRKNCESARICRQRKKEHLQSLEKSETEIRSQLAKRRARIERHIAQVISSFRQADSDKSKYLEQKIRLSQQLIGMCRKLRERGKKQKEDNWEELANSSQSLNRTGKGLRRRVAHAAEKGREEGLVSEEETLQLMIDSFLFKFGVAGGLRYNIIQSLKANWLKLVSDNIQESQRSSQIKNFRKAFELVDTKIKSLDYSLRELKEILRPEQIVKFLLKAEFAKRYEMGESQQ